MSASQWSGKEAIKGWGEPSCAGPRHVEEEVGSRERWGQTPHTLNTTLWKRNWQPQINSRFQWIISSFHRNNPLLPFFFPVLPLLSSSLCTHATLFSPFQPSKPLKLQDVWKENFSCVAYLSLPPLHLHLIKTSEITHMSVWEYETVLIFGEHMALWPTFPLTSVPCRNFALLLDGYCWQKTDLSCYCVWSKWGILTFSFFYYVVQAQFFRNSNCCM